MTISKLGAISPQFAGTPNKTQKTAQPQFAAQAANVSNAKLPTGKSQLFAPIIQALSSFTHLLTGCFTAPLHLITSAFGGLSSHILRPLLKVVSFGYLG